MKRRNSICYPYGALVLEIIDQGVGMTSEEYKLLFKDIVQFNPQELQVGLIRKHSHLGFILFGFFINLFLCFINLFLGFGISSTYFHIFLFLPFSPLLLCVKYFV